MDSSCWCCCYIVGTVLDGNSEAASLLSRVVHQDVEFHVADEPAFESLGSVTLSEESIGIWIDPIGTFDTIVCMLF